MPEITRGLGKGIRALIPEGSPISKEEIIKIPLRSIRVNRFQPRKNLDDSRIQELANSIKESGLIYPLLVRKTNQSGDESIKYELIAGERRFRALKLAGFDEAPALIRDVDDRKSLELALIENLQRENLNPIEQAMAYQRLIQEFGLTQEKAAEVVGKDRTTVANTIRLLKLPASIQHDLADEKLTLGHARTLLGLESEKAQLELAKKIVSGGWSVRQVEQAVATRRPASRARQTKDPHLAEVEHKLQKALGTNVQLLHGKSRGWVRIAYYSLKDLDRLIQRLT